MTEQIKVVINGVLGRMGKEIARCVCSDPSLSMVGCLERPDHEGIGKDIGPYIGREPHGITVQSSIPAMDDQRYLVIDFSQPESCCSLLRSLSGTNACMVVGTTGLTLEQRSCIAQTSRCLPILHSPNMSLGMNMLLYLARICTKLLPDDFDIEIVEMHHRFKKDAPSSSALALAEIMARERGIHDPSHFIQGRSGISPGRTKKEIGIHALRGGDCVGDHSVLFAGTGEKIELRHVVQDRTIFASGAINAGKWLYTQKPGLYSMQDLFHFQHQ